MKNLWSINQIIYTAIGGWLGYYIGGCDGLFITLVIFVLTDYISGVMCAIDNKTLSSKIGFKGIATKILIFLIVGLANIIDLQIIKDGNILRTATIFFYLSNEGISIMENAAHLGLPIPDSLVDVLEELHNRKKKDEGN